MRNDNYPKAFSCLTFLLGRIQGNHQLRLHKIECLAKTGATDDALKELNSLDNQKTPETLYLKGLVELYSGKSAKAKTFFT